MSIIFDYDEDRALILGKNMDLLCRYLAEAENLPECWKLNYKTNDPKRGVSMEYFTLQSQRWPKPAQVKTGENIWQHQLVIYRPELIKTSQALLFVNGGTRNLHAEQDNPLPHVLDFARLAAETQSVIIDLQDVPNQYLIFEDAISRKGDAMYAYSWNRFMNENQQSYWPLSLPMTKAVIKAMDAVQEIMSREYFISIEHFVLAGLSKRGLAAWLAALHDERVCALVPVVIDTLNTKVVMKHIYECYQAWPQAFYEFINEKIHERMPSKEFDRLMEIEDPLAYLYQDPDSFYKKRLSIPKLIISASGDDFFTPDCVRLYLDLLPGETCIRLVPNQGHLMDLKIVEDALLAYYQSLLKHSHRPQIQWRVNHAGLLCHVVSNQPPTQVRLWQAENLEKRDFRLAEKISYFSQDLVGSFYQRIYQYPIQMSVPIKGWKSHFVELTFQTSQQTDWIVTTPAYVVGV